MSPAASICCQMAIDARWWRSSVVRMNWSFEHSSRSTMALKRGTLRSTSCGGVSFSFAAVCSILMPCSSVPVTKSTS